MGATEILIVEDNPADAKLAAEALLEASASTHVTIKPTGEEAIAFLQDPLAPRNDLIFMDLHLPGKGGLEVLAELQRDTRLKNIPVVILTGSIDPKELAELKKYQNFQHLIKPKDLDEYIIRLKAILESVSVH
jgi:chemotaxis family two-component system response regulator Rcp1